MKAVGIVLKLAATAGLLWLVLSKVDFAELAGRVNAWRVAAALAAGVAILSLQAYLIALRLRLCARTLGHRIGIGSAWVASQYGGFFSHTPISFVGGDAMRVWHMVRSGLPLGDSAKAVFMDRALGFTAMMVLGLGSAFGLRSVITDPRMWAGLLVLLAAGTTACVAFFALGYVRIPVLSSRLLRTVVRFATASRDLVEHPGLAAEAFLIALALTALNIVAIWAISLGYSAGISLGTAFSAAPIVFLIAMAPVSVAGWGLREGAFVVALGLFGVPAAVSLTASLTLGIAMLLTYLPAPVLFVLARHRFKAEPSMRLERRQAPPAPTRRPRS